VLCGPAACGCCGHDLDGEPVLGTPQKRQVFEVSPCARTFSVMMAASLAVMMWAYGKAPLDVFRRGLGVRGGGLVVSLP
jgi:hypothetical protein